ncbi:MAG: choice-of-anchor F family protein [bacterium]|nr:choice-of-anchor F family protein [bacterium]
MSIRSTVIARSFAGSLAIALILASTAHTEAAEITGVNWFSGVASVASTVFSPPVAPNNDNVAGSSLNSIFVTQKDYVAIGPVDLVFDLIDTGGVTEYVIVEGVQNNTGLDWSGYHIELGFGNGAGFVPSTPGDGLDFDSPDFDSPVFFDPSPGFFPSQIVTVDDILAGGGIMPDFSFAGNFVFTVDVPDGISSFTIRQSPIAVPEPSSTILGLLGLLGVLAYRRLER